MSDSPENSSIRLRFGTGCVMIVLALFGLILTNIKSDLAWNYWQIVALVFALISLLLSWILHKRQGALTFSLVWHELALWSGMALCIYLVTVLERLGHIGKFGASLQILILLALTLFAAGLFTEITLLPVGVLLALFAAGFAIVTQYFYFVVVPLTLVALIALYLLAKKRPRSTP